MGKKNKNGTKQKVLDWAQTLPSGIKIDFRDVGLFSMTKGRWVN